MLYNQVNYNFSHTLRMRWVRGKQCASLIDYVRIRVVSTITENNVVIVMDHIVNTRVW